LAKEGGEQDVGLQSDGAILQVGGFPILYMIYLYMHSKKILKTRHYDSTRHLNRKGVFPLALQILLRAMLISDGK
jgi:hypothetical protein